MSARSNKRRIYRLLHNHFQRKFLWTRSAEEQAWLDVPSIGREFGSPDYERLQILDLYAATKMSSEVAMLELGISSLENLHQQIAAAGLVVPPPTP